MADSSPPDDEGLDDRLRVHRDAIDVLDRDILTKLSERAVHAKAIGELKAGTGAPAYRPDREVQLNKSLSKV